MISTGSIGEVPILLAKPQAYMNYSGEAVCSYLMFQFLLWFLICISVLICLNVCSQPIYGTFLLGLKKVVCCIYLIHKVHH